MKVETEGKGCKDLKGKRKKEKNNMKRGKKGDQ